MEKLDRTSAVLTHEHAGKLPRFHALICVCCVWYAC